jgi:hypothetical protein
MKLMKSNRSEMSTTIRFGNWVNSITVHDVYHSGDQWSSVMFFHSPPHRAPVIVKIADPHGVLAHSIRTYNPESGASQTRLMDLIQTARLIDEAGQEAEAAWDSFMRELAPAY